MGPEYHDDDLHDPRDIPHLTDDDTDGEAQDGNLEVQSTTESSHGPPLPVPVWMQESARSFKFRWVPLPLRKAARATARWIKGPIPPRELKIIPYYPKLQEAPVRLLDRYLPKRRHKLILLLACYAVWLLTWSLMLWHNSNTSFITGYGKPTNIWCGANFWQEGSGCGLNGNECRPFSSSHMAFRCPAECKGTHLLEERIVGNQSVIYTGLVVGGPKAEAPESIPIYRADSFICQAAIHAGVVSNSEGGCGVATLVGAHNDFQASEAHGISSIGFPATFPRSFTFQTLSKSQAHCPNDSRWGLFAVTAVVLVLISIFTTSPAAFFFSAFFILFLQVGLVSDPPNLSNFRELLSTLCGRLLPASFVAYILYRSAAVPLLSNLTAQLEKTVLYLGFCFVGALNNYTFAPLIPIQRLTPHDLRQPGAPLALAVIVSSILAIVVGQVHFIRVSGNMPRYLKIYIGMCVSLLILLVLPGLRLRIHHYILAMLFMPGTAFRTRPSLIYQGLLLGLFVNGIARWGFDSIIQTPSSLGESAGRGGGAWWGAKAPNVTAIVAPDVSNITFNWGPLPTGIGIDGVSILVNDVERWRGYIDEELYWDQEEVTIQRRKREAREIEYFRFAWVNGNRAGKYSRVGIWDEDGTWYPIDGQ